jgi:phage terminase large subunit GpA-like protein
MLSKEFPAGLLIITGANSAVGLRSMPARYLFLDEVDAYPPSADEEGDVVALAEAHTRTFSWRSKIYLTSTPTIHGLSRIEREFEASDQSRFFVPCPHCGAMQWLKFERLRWEKAKPDTAQYACEACEGPIEERHKTAMLGQGEWRATATPANPGTIGFHLSALYSPGGYPGPTLPGCGRPRRQPMRPSAASRTAFSARLGLRRGKRPIGSGSMNATNPGASACCPPAAYS